LIRNPFSSERAGGRVAGKNRNISVHLPPFEMDPGSVIPDLIRDRGDDIRCLHRKRKRRYRQEAGRK
jgi:hypothetical protein